MPAGVASLSQGASGGAVIMDFNPSWRAHPRGGGRRGWNPARSKGTPWGVDCLDVGTAGRGPQALLTRPTLQSATHAAAWGGTNGARTRLVLDQPVARSFPRVSVRSGQGRELCSSRPTHSGATSEGRRAHSVRSPRAGWAYQPLPPTCLAGGGDPTGSKTAVRLPAHSLPPRSAPTITTGPENRTQDRAPGGVAWAVTGQSGGWTGVRVGRTAARRSSSTGPCRTVGGARRTSGV